MHCVFWVGDVGPFLRDTGQDHAPMPASNLCRHRSHNLSTHRITRSWHNGGTGITSDLASSYLQILLFLYFFCGELHFPVSRQLYFGSKHRWERPKRIKQRHPSRNLGCMYRGQNSPRHDALL